VNDVSACLIRGPDRFINAHEVLAGAFRLRICDEDAFGVSDTSVLNKLSISSVHRDPIFDTFWIACWQEGRQYDAGLTHVRGSPNFIKNLVHQFVRLANTIVAIGIVGADIDNHDVGLVTLRALKVGKDILELGTRLSLVVLDLWLIHNDPKPTDPKRERSVLTLSLNPVPWVLLPTMLTGYPSCRRADRRG
jgi:hypothetical protein